MEGESRGGWGTPGNGRGSWACPGALSGGRWRGENVGFQDWGLHTPWDSWRLSSHSSSDGQVGETEARRRWQEGLICISALSSQKPAPPSPPTPPASRPAFSPGPLPSPLLSHHLSLSHQLPRVPGSSRPPAAPPLCTAPPARPAACVCPCERVRVRVCRGAGWEPACLSSSRRSQPGPTCPLCAQTGALPPRTGGSCFFLYLPVFSPLSLPLQRSRQRLLE